MSVVNGMNGEEILRQVSFFIVVFILKPFICFHLLGIAALPTRTFEERRPRYCNPRSDLVCVRRTEQTPCLHEPNSKLRP